MLEQRERLSRAEGHVIIARVDYRETGQRSQSVENITSHSLPPGEALVFVGEGDKPVQSLSCTQEHLAEALEALPGDHEIHLIALADRQTGRLFVTKGTPDEVLQIGPKTPPGQRVISQKLGMSEISCMWGRTEQQAKQTLRMFTQMRTR